MLGFSDIFFELVNLTGSNPYVDKDMKRSREVKTKANCCDYCFNRLGKDEKRQGKTLCKKCSKSESNKTKKNDRCDVCGETYCKSYNGGTACVKMTTQQKKDKMKITHFYYDTDKQQVHLIGNNGRAFSTSEDTAKEMVVDYPKNEADPAFLYIDDRTQYIMFPIEHLSNALYTTEQKKLVTKCIEAAHQVNINRSFKSDLASKSTGAGR